ncbi:MAG: hypothetical protein HQK85_12500, partial [Nitrospinae bacterium]|nr:hypothetical protein [Nitrospinota bacterium]
DSQMAYPVLRDWGDVIVYAKSKQRSGLGSNVGLVMENQSPYRQGRTVVTMTAVSAGDVLALSQALLEPEVHSNLKGDLSLVQLTAPDYKVDTESVGEKYSIGKRGKFSWKDYLLSTIQEYYYSFLVMAFVLLSAVFYFMLKAQERRRISGDRRGAQNKDVGENKREGERREAKSVGRRILSFLSQLIFKSKPPRE